MGLLKSLFILERGRGREEGSEALLETLIGCLPHVPQLGTKPTTQACVLTRIRTNDLLVCGMTLNQLSYTSQGKMILFKNEYFIV